MVKNKSRTRETRGRKESMTDEDTEAKRARVRNLKLSVDKPQIIGCEEEIIPFSWRYPLAPPEDEKMTKVYREGISNEKALSFYDGEKK